MNRATDIRIHEAITEWIVDAPFDGDHWLMHPQSTSSENSCPVRLPHYTTNMIDAWEIVHALHDRFPAFHVGYDAVKKEWHATFAEGMPEKFVGTTIPVHVTAYLGIGRTAAEAITDAAMNALGINGEVMWGV